MPSLTVPYSATPARPIVESGISPAMAERLISEGLIDLAAVAKLLPSVRGKRVSTSSILRWILRGKSGIRLEAVRLHGASWFTSTPAVARFAALLTSRNVNF